MESKGTRRGRGKQDRPTKEKKQKRGISGGGGEGGGGEGEGEGGGGGGGGGGVRLRRKLHLSSGKAVAIARQPLPSHTLPTKFVCSFDHPKNTRSEHPISIEAFLTYPTLYGSSLTPTPQDVHYPLFVWVL
eukprot:756872-Hanusia_phi.AAC.9